MTADSALNDSSRDTLERAIADAEAARAHAERAARVCEDLLTTVSHELRNPLSTITAGVALLERLAGDDENGGRIRKYAATMTRSADRMNRLVNDLLDFANIREGKLSIQRAVVPVAALIDESVEVFRPVASTTGVHLTGTSPDGLLVCCQRDRVLQVLANLIGNALKFTPAGGRVHLEAAQAGSEVQFSVADTGSGIAAAELPHLFDRFWQGRRGQGRDGFGLGLFIVKGLVDAHDGRVWAHSTVGVGTTFYFALPADASGDDTIE